MSEIFRISYFCIFSDAFHDFFLLSHSYLHLSRIIMKIFGKLWTDGDCSTISDESSTKNINKNINNSNENRKKQQHILGQDTRPVCGVSVYTAAATLSSLAQSGCMDDLLVCSLAKVRGSKVRTYSWADLFFLFFSFK